MTAAALFIHVFLVVLFCNVATLGQLAARRMQIGLSFRSPTPKARELARRHYWGAAGYAILAAGNCVFFVAGVLALTRR